MIFGHQKAKGETMLLSSLLLDSQHNNLKQNFPGCNALPGSENGGVRGCCECVVGPGSYSAPASDCSTDATILRACFYWWRCQHELVGVLFGEPLGSARWWVGSLPVVPVSW